MSSLIKLAATLLFFCEAFAWLAVAYAVFVLIGPSVLAWVAAIGTFIAVVVAWGLFASPKAPLASRASVIAVRTLVYAAAVAGLLIVGPAWAGIALGVLLLACEGLLIARGSHEALTASTATGRH